MTDLNIELLYVVLEHGKSGISNWRVWHAIIDTKKYGGITREAIDKRLFKLTEQKRIFPELGIDFGIYVVKYKAICYKETK